MSRKMITSICLVMIFSLMLISSVAAHEIWSNYPKRWYDVSYDSGLQHNVVTLKTNGDYLNSDFSTSYVSSRTAWTSYSDDYVDCVYESFSTSKIDLCSHANWPSEWGSNTAAITFAEDSDGDWWVDWTTLEYNTACGSTLVYAQIYVNPAYDNYSTSIKKWICSHEIGHTMGLGHPSSSTVSVMHTGTVPTWTDYYSPQDHGRSDLADFY